MSDKRATRSGRDAEKRLGMLEEAVNRWNQFAQGQAKYGTPPLNADGVNTSREKV